MSRVEDLVGASRRYARAWKEFIEMYKKAPSKLYCFFEGPDDLKYYSMRVDSIVFDHRDSLRCSIWCDGKENVIELYNLIKNEERYNKSWVAFFIDRDFDEYQFNSFDETVYVTPCYSIENLYVSEKCFSNIVKDELCISESDEDYQHTLLLYRKLLDEFNDAAEVLNAWVCACRKMEKNADLPKLNLDSFPLEKMFSIRLDGVRSFYTLDDLNNRTQGCEITEELINKYILQFRSANRTYMFRGKFLLFFLTKILRHLVEDANLKSNRKHFAIRRKTSLQISDNILSELCQYAETPEALIVFLHYLRQQRPIQLLLH